MCVAPPSAMASPGMPCTMELSRSCAIVNGAEIAQVFQLGRAVLAHAGEQHADAEWAALFGERAEQPRHRGPERVLRRPVPELDESGAADAEMKVIRREIDVPGSGGAPCAAICTRKAECSD